ncbi:MAG TPA: 8-oxoguanine deaminase [Rectinemataceae bacterium]|nr:8-oxoguanine deaminase [Rectinemataceae bacterium]
MILLKDCFRVLSHDGPDLAGVDVLIDGNRIARVAENLAAPAGSRLVDARRLVVTPGLVNTHHHFYQTLTRNLPAVQDAKLFDWLVALYEVWKGIDEEAVRVSSLLAMSELLRTGCTTTTDHHYLYPSGFTEDLPAIQFEAASELGIRFAPTRGSMSLSKKNGGLPPDSVVQDEELILRHSEDTIVRFHDPAPDSMRRVALAPCSPFSVSESLMKRSAALARRHGVRLHTHLAETADENDFCVQVYGRRPLKLMEDCDFIGPDVWYAHGIFFDDAELDLLAKTKTGVAHCPSSNMRLGSGIARVREMLDRGVPVGLAVDGSASNDSSDMLGEARQALLLQRVRYGSAGLRSKEAWRIATEGGAKMLGWEESGRIAEGALADIALWRIDGPAYAGSLSDPTAALLFCGYDHRADMVIANGKIVVEEGKVLGVDEEKLAAAANLVAKSLLEKAEIA